MTRPPTLIVPVRNRLDDIGRVAALVEEFGRSHHVPEDVILCVNLALDEVLTNVISYAYADAQEHEVLLRVRLDAGDIVVEVEDDGRAFDPLEVPDVDPRARVEAGTVGGLGVHIVRMVMDRLAYRRERGRNVLVMRKGAQVPP